MLSDSATLAEQEVARFLARQPSVEEILAFHLAPEIAERFYDLVDAERHGSLDDEERQELDAYLHVEHLMRLIKAEARGRRDQQAS